MNGPTSLRSSDIALHSEGGRLVARWKGWARDMGPAHGLVEGLVPDTALRPVRSHAELVGVLRRNMALTHLSSDWEAASAHGRMAILACRPRADHPDI